MQLTREQIKTMIREEIEEALKINKRGKKPNLVTRKQQALSGPTASPKDALKGDTVAPDDEPSDEEKQQAARDKLYSRTQGSKMKGYIDPVTGKKKIKLVAPETEDDRQRREQDLYREELQERIFKDLVAKIRGDK